MLITEDINVDPGGDDADLYEGLDDVRPVIQPQPSGLKRTASVATSAKVAPEKKGNGVAAAKATAVGAARPVKSEDVTNRTLLMANLQWWTTDAEIEALCAAHGEVEEVEFYQDEATGKSKGCVRVIMASPAQALVCKKALGGKVIGGRKCTVTLAAPAADRKQLVAQKPGGHGPDQGRKSAQQPAAVSHNRGRADAAMRAGMRPSLPPLPPGMMGIPMPPGMGGMPMPGMPFFPGPAFNSREAAHPHQKRPRR
eukprot:jgi/Botrbrau1/18204/Bobra.53_1s0063.1